MVPGQIQGALGGQDRGRAAGTAGFAHGDVASVALLELVDELGQRVVVGPRRTAVGAVEVGLQEHVFCLKNSITDFRHQSGKLYVMFLDLADAFGSIDHEMMVDALSAYGYPDSVIQLTKDIYTDSTFQVDTNSGLTDSIVRHRGIIQGCPYSVIAFEQGIDIWLRWFVVTSSHLFPIEFKGMLTI